MDVGAVGGWDYENYNYVQDGVYAIGFKGKRKGKGSKGGKGRVECYSCGSTGPFPRERPHPYKGKGKGSQG